VLLVDECRSLPAREVIHGSNRHMTVKDATHVPQLLTIRARRFGTKARRQAAGWRAALLGLVRSAWATQSAQACSAVMPVAVAI
jgi:hypothetical protein